jgi:hypothetical protein
MFNNEIACGRAIRLERVKDLATLIADKFKAWEREAQERFDQLKANEEELNKIFIDLYGLQDELDYHVPDDEISVSKADKERDIKSLISYAVGCMFGRYSLDMEGLVYAGGEFDPSKYSKFPADKDNILLITDEEYFKDSSIDIVNKFIEFVEVVYGKETLEENLQYIADTLGGSGTPREIIRKYFVKGFYDNHMKIYKKRPIYWQFESGRLNGAKALMYLHRYDEKLLNTLKLDYLSKLKTAYEERLVLRLEQKSISKRDNEKQRLSKDILKLNKQLKELHEFNGKISRLALMKISLDLDDGVVANYEKLQTDETGRKIKILSRR